jgi:diguanylate cyclase (GGDEF)-like protein
MPTSRTQLRRSPQLAWFLTGPLALLGIVLIVIAAAKRDNLLSPLPSSLLFFVLFLAAEAAILKIEVRRHVIQTSATEIPLLLGLFYLQPIVLLILRVLASALIQAFRRTQPIKAAFNVASIAAATSIAALIVASADTPDVKSPSTWLVLVGAVVVSIFATAVSVVGVISLVQGRISPSDMAETVAPSMMVASVNAIAGLVVLLVLHVSPWAVLLLLLLAGAIVAIYRAYAQFLRQHKSLTQIYDLARVVAAHPYDGTIADVLLQRVRALMRSEYATLWTPSQGRYPESLLSARADDKGLLDLGATPLAVRQRAVDTGTTIVVTPKLGDDQLRTDLRAAGTKDAIVVPLRSGGAVIGTLEVAGRMGDATYFTEEDARLLETIAAHASVAVENARLVDRLRFDANHDTLTGLPNRRRMMQALEEAVKVRAPGEVVAVMVFDVDGLRDVNDSLGHAAGDKLLVEFGRRLRDLCPPAALVGRLGGDKFAVTLRMPGVDAATAMATSLRESVNLPMEFGSLSLDLDSAAGISVHPDHGSDPASLLQQADVAAHAAKSQPHALQLFDPSLESGSVRRLGLASDLRRALDTGALKLYYQPKVSLASRQVTGVECLARWDHPVHGPVAPEDFVSVAEHTGQLGRFTEFVLREGLSQARDWVDAGRSMPISVNLSPRTLLDRDFPDLLQRLLREFAVAPELLTLEITGDSVLSQSDRQLPILRRLDALGVALSLDDFGAGSSSLEYLRRIPVDEVKIDRSFVQGMATSPGDLAIVRAVVDLARHFNLRVVAEGVESERTLSLLAEMGCDSGQGFLFSRPLPYDRLEAWLAAQTEPELSAAGEVRRLRAVT